MTSGATEAAVSLACRRETPMIAPPMSFSTTHCAILLSSLILAGSTDAQTVPASQPSAQVAETLMYTIPDDAKVVDTVVSGDNLHLGIVEKKGDAFHVVVNNVRGPAEEWVIRRSLLFSAEGGRFAYQIQKANQMMVVVGQAGPAWKAEVQPGYFMIGRIVFSHDGKRYAYLAQKVNDGKMQVVVDGEPQPEVDEVLANDMQFSPDGAHFAYRVRVRPAQPDPANPNAGGTQYYVIDGKPQPAHEMVTRLRFSSTGGRWGYISRDGLQSSMVMDGRPSQPQAVVAGLTFSEDGKRYAYAVEAAGPDGKPGGKQSLVYNAGDGEKQFQAFDGIGTIVFSPDGRRLAITTMTEKTWSITVDGKSTGQYEGTGGMLFSPDNTRLAAVAGRGGRQFLVVDGKESSPVDVVVTAGFSPDSRRIASVVIMGAQRTLFLDDKRIGPATFFAFSTDGARLGHALPEGQDQWRLAIDGQPVGPAYDAAPPGARIVWESATTARIIGGRGRDMFMVKLTVGP